MSCLCPFLFPPSFFIFLSVAFYGCLDQGEGKGDEEAEDQPDVDHLGVRGRRQLLDLAREDGRHHQHDGQVHREARLKVDCLEEGGGVGDGEQEQGGQVGGQQLCLNLPLQGHHHVHLFVIFLKSEICDGEHDEVFVLDFKLLEFFGFAGFVRHQHLIEKGKSSFEYNCLYTLHTYKWI